MGWAGHAWHSGYVTANTTARTRGEPLHALSTGR